MGWHLPTPSSFQDDPVNLVDLIKPINLVEPVDPGTPQAGPPMTHPDHAEYITVVVPCHNEADNVEDAYRAVVAALADHDLDLLFVDDGSTDGTLSILRRIADTDPRMRYLSFTRNFGFEAAFSAGFRYAGAPWVLQLDADLQFPPTEARKLISRACDGYDAVYGVRENRDDPVIRRYASRFYHFVGERVLGIRIPPGATTFRVLRTSLAQRIVNSAPTVPYFMGTVPLLTSRYTTVRVAHRARAHGKSKFRLRRLASHALELYFGFSTRLGALVTGALLLAAVATAAVGILSAAGVVGTAGTLQAALFAQALALLALAAATRYLVMPFAAHQRPVLFCIREANFPVRPADLLEPVPYDATDADGTDLSPTLAARRPTRTNGSAAVRTPTSIGESK
ncbi:MAG TPA: glycosyltransferase family 2 protein [Mycobacteriales bacterium]